MFPPIRVLGGQLGTEHPIAMPCNGGICWGQYLALRTPGCAYPAWMDLMERGFMLWGLCSFGKGSAFPTSLLPLGRSTLAQPPLQCPSPQLVPREDLRVGGSAGAAAP